MSVISKLASSLGRRDEVPNQELARELAVSGNMDDIRELAEHLFDNDNNIAADCIKTLYELGYQKPELIAPYYESYVKLLKHKNNRMVWGGMIALSCIGHVCPGDLFPFADTIAGFLKTGSVITIDGAVLTLAGIASGKPEYARKVFPFLFEHLRTTRPKDIPQHSEKIVTFMNDEFKGEFAQILKERESELTGTQQTRVKKVLKKLG